MLLDSLWSWSSWLSLQQSAVIKFVFSVDLISLFLSERDTALSNRIGYGYSIPYTGAKVQRICK